LSHHEVPRQCRRKKRKRRKGRERRERRRTEDEEERIQTPIDVVHIRMPGRRSP
jgi:hypothetical protein